MPLRASTKFPIFIPITADQRSSGKARGAVEFSSFLTRNSNNLRLPQNRFFEREHVLAFENGDDLSAAIAELASEAAQAGTAPVIFGGDHSVTWHIIRALATRHANLHLITFDAHSDCQGDEVGLRSWNYLEFVRRSLGRNVRITVVGFRDIDAENLSAVADVVYDEDEVISRGPAEIFREIRTDAGSIPTHVSVDLDVLDPSFFRSVSAPISGGMSPAELLFSIRSLHDVNIVSADIVEYDFSETRPHELLLLADLFHALGKVCDHEDRFRRSDINRVRS